MDPLSLPLAEPYKLRWLTKEQSVEAVNLYHLARVTTDNTKHARMVQASKWMADKYEGLTSTAVYKDLCGILEGY